MKVFIKKAKLERVISCDEVKNWLPKNDYTRIEAMHHVQSQQQTLLSRLLLKEAYEVTYPRESHKLKNQLITQSSQKPVLNFDLEHPFYFNISHSANNVVMAYSKEMDVGIDLEKIKPLKNFEGLVQKVFHPDEVPLLVGKKPELCLPIFFKTWVGKESVLKLTGLGIKHGMDQFALEERSEQFAYAKLGKINAFVHWLPLDEPDLVLALSTHVGLQASQIELLTSK